MEKSVKIFGACLVLLGLFTGVCLMVVNHSVDNDSLEHAYKSGVLMGAAITECVIGTLMINIGKK